jgi:hypothetical protein
MDPIVAITLALAVVNATVSGFAMRSASLLRSQKLAQCLVIWAVPLLGAIVVAIFLVSNREPPHRQTHHTRNEEDYPGVNLSPPHGPSDP